MCKVHIPKHDQLKVLHWYQRVYIIVLQQVEGNIIYPRVVGSAIGLSGFWVLLAVTVGGGLFGVMGILLGVPLMAVLYTLYGGFVNKKIAEKDIGEMWYSDL